MSRTTEWVPSLWRDTFRDMLDDELDNEDQWTLNFNYTQTATITSEERQRGWKVYSPCAYGNFRCVSCDKTWGSARVVVLFRYRLRQNRGSVIMRPFRQACRTCSGHYVLPGFSHDEVEKALLRLFSKIRKNCYGEDEDDGSAGRSYKKWSKPHEANLCEACHLGICCQED